MDRILDVLSDYAGSMTYEKLSESVVHQVKQRVIDTLGCAMGSYNMRPPKIARAHALEVTSTPGSTVLGSRHQIFRNWLPLPMGLWRVIQISTT